MAIRVAPLGCVLSGLLLASCACARPVAARTLRWTSMANRPSAARLRQSRPSSRLTPDLLPKRSFGGACGQGSDLVALRRADDVWGAVSRRDEGRTRVNAKADSFLKDIDDVKKDDAQGSGPRTYYRTLFVLNVRQDEDISSPMLGRLPPGSRVSVREIRGRRALLETQGVEGWVSLVTEDGEANVEYLSGPDGSSEQIKALAASVQQQYAHMKTKEVPQPGEGMPLALQIALPFLAIASGYVAVSLVNGWLVTTFFPSIFKGAGAH
uniref:SH3b domain-containing protein n=1 Tax=Lotharella globosa TaxID=91324 RepID=A0A7S3Z3T1_9EUKA|mmetsp:Transcript_16530/g.33486  ORF Transcript_16530/g.33486 Transcript_16530/m.33486 type:complete len:267 (+) Transcript_16530:22-822(+)